MNHVGPTLQFLIEGGWHHVSICITLHQYGIKHWQLRWTYAQIYVEPMPFLKVGPTILPSKCQHMNAVWEVTKFSSAYQQNGFFHAKGVVILDTVHNLMSNPTEIEATLKCRFKQSQLSLSFSLSLSLSLSLSCLFYTSVAPCDM